MGVRVDIGKCPCCGKKLDGHTSLGDTDAQPRPGDICVCFYCVSVLIVEERPSNRTGKYLAFRRTSPDEYLQILRDVDGLEENLEKLRAFKRGIMN